MNHHQRDFIGALQLNFTTLDIPPQLSIDGRVRSLSHLQSVTVLHLEPWSRYESRRGLSWLWNLTEIRKSHSNWKGSNKWAKCQPIYVNSGIAQDCCNFITLPLFNSHCIAKFKKNNKISHIKPYSSLCSCTRIVVTTLSHQVLQSLSKSSYWNAQIAKTINLD